MLKMVAETQTFLNIKVQKSLCVYEGFSENSITFPSDSLLQNANKDKRELRQAVNWWIKLIGKQANSPKNFQEFILNTFVFPGHIHF